MNTTDPKIKSKKSKSKSKSKSSLEVELEVGLKNKNKNKNKDKDKNQNKSKKFDQKYDPNAGKEADKYEDPIASREWILELLKDRCETGAFLTPGLSKEQIAELLKIKKPAALEALHRRLRAMVRDGQLVCSSKGFYSPYSEAHEVRGKVDLLGSDFFVLNSAGNQEKIYLPEKQVLSVFPGDEVSVKIVGLNSNDRYIGQVTVVHQRNTHQVVGRLNEEQGVFYLVPENAHWPHKILLLPEERKNLKKEIKKGEIVLCQIILQPTYHTQAMGRVKEILGDALDLKTAITAASNAFNIPYEWPEDVIKEIKQFSEEEGQVLSSSLSQDLAGREDLRNLNLVTIDGVDAKDFDDAVYCQKDKSGGWRLWVAIADVSHYVEKDSALDQEAERRGNSVYFPNHVVPMLPEILSNGLCSLKPNVDRFCLVCEMKISGQGKLMRYKFYPAVMNSKARLTYDQVYEILTQENSPLRVQAPYAKLLPDILELEKLYLALKAARLEKGALDFETLETKILFDNKGKITDFGVYVRNDAHCLIEECMLVANIAAARQVEKLNVPGVFRVHEGPKLDKTEDLRVFLKLSRIPFISAQALPTTKDLAQVLNYARGRPDYRVIQTMVLRSMNQAIYSVENLGHFGLCFEAYTHFTSPIRRYPDLLVHRLLKNKSKFVLYTENKLNSLADHASMTERRADEATRDVVSALKCAYMKEHIGYDFSGVISGVTGFGFFVTLDTMPVDGLVHIASIGDDYYHYDSGSQTLMGERRRRVFRLGDAVKVKLVRVDVAGRKIDFELNK